MILIKPNNELLKAAQSIFGKELIINAYECTPMYSGEHITDEDVQTRIKYCSIDLKLDVINTMGNSIGYGVGDIMLRLINGREVIFTTSEFAYISNKPIEEDFMEII